MLPLERVVVYVARTSAQGAEVLEWTPPSPGPADLPTVSREVLIRPATLTDLPAVNKLRNHYIATSTAIYTDQPTPDEVFRCTFENRDTTRHPMTIAEIAGQFAGYGMLSKHDEKCGYAATVEDSVYVDPKFHRQGVGGAIMSDLIHRADAIGHRCILARIDTNQHPSLALHLRYGFTPVGILRSAGEKFGRVLDVALLQRVIFK